MIQLKKRYGQPGIKTYIKLEDVIVKPVTSCSEVIDVYTSTQSWMEARFMLNSP